MEPDNRIFLDQLFGRDGDDVPDLSEIPQNAIGEFIKTTAEDFKFGKAAVDVCWSEPVGRVVTEPTFRKVSNEPKLHADGRFTERDADGGLWTLVYEGGKLVRQRLDSESLPGGTIEFDAEANEITAV
jgi:hypothetical protein